MAKLEFRHYDMGQLSSGDMVEVTLTGAANVRLMTSSNLSSYKNGRSHRYVGGLVTQSPYRMGVPHSGHWHVTVDLVGLRSRSGVRSKARVLPKLLPLARQAPLQSVPLSSLPSLVQGAGANDDVEPDEAPHRSFDVFICHASENKDDVVRPLAHALAGHGLQVWYDEFELKIGNSLRRKIDHGIANSRFGVVVLSAEFFAKGWPNYELDGLVTKGIDNEQIILPVWHNVTKAEVISYSPSLADKLARSTSTHTVEEIAAEISSLFGES